MLINGMVSETHINGKWSDGVESRVKVINFENIIIMIIIIKFISIDIGITDENRSFVLYFLFDINLEIIVGYEKIAIVDKSDIVGVSKL